MSKPIDPSDPASQPNSYRTGPDERGFFGLFGGRFVAETLMPLILDLEGAYNAAKADPKFAAEVTYLNKHYSGRPSPLYFAKRMTDELRKVSEASGLGGGAKIYFKRDELNHTGSHKINNCLGQILLAKRMGKTRIIAETGAGQHGVAVATVCAKFDLPCEIYMGATDIERQAPNVARMKLLGAKLNSVTSGAGTLKDAMNEALRDWVTNVSDTYYIIGTAAGPHPYPQMVRDFQSVIGNETRAFAHVPLILNRDRSKMSKRSGEAAVAVGDYRRGGFLAEALLSYLALLGFHPGDDREILSRADLLEAFSLERVGRSGSVFDPDKLRWVNAHYLHHASGEELLLWGADFLPAAARGLPRAEQVRLLEAVKGNLATLADLPGELAPMLGEVATPDEEAAAVLAAPRSREICAALADNLETVADWSGEAVKSALLAAGQRLGIKGRELYQPVRAALTGRVHGPELPVVAGTLGRERCIARLRGASR